MFTIRFTFTKRGRMRYISHLDLMRLLTRALRRARMPLKLTEGFSPHPKLSLARALKLGVESDQEEAAISLVRPVRPDEFVKMLQPQLPEGIEIKQALFG
jgi:radical SAM-linked protein